MAYHSDATEVILNNIHFAFKVTVFTTMKDHSHVKLFLKEIICSQRSKFFPFRVAQFENRFG